MVVTNRKNSGKIHSKFLETAKKLVVIQLNSIGPWNTDSIPFPTEIKRFFPYTIIACFDLLGKKNPQCWKKKNIVNHKRKIYILTTY